jgi:hypothetical protein
MPFHTQWVEPELFLEQAGVRVFHTYKDDDLDQGRKRYWFSLNPECGVAECQCEKHPCQNVFDVRRLPTWQPRPPPPHCTGKHNTPENHAAWERYWQEEDAAIKAAITSAIERGDLPLRVPQEPLPA